ncbi:amidohydrolase family protein [Agrobacterium rubi]|uniref:Amidohydrolase family protein n=1 Tax=Agrobacterium rubi TaxID=28099 RepID=A0AAE7R756_9HYPH|nr:amidohydrolase family protein [Agrobacterium rubi]NTF03697.1 amidohydrolase family protein [Agrobacterium rubi]NTF38023.1 amidohydrolase family protein [Agrobacterium rubi]OCJ43743.1 amidohydrolase [Agrobacterium rubi]QTG03153.1 amidohydrolase family protein [Agrobacterium rubi]
MFDLVLRNARLPGQHGLVDIAVKDGRIAAIGANFRCDAVTEEDVEGNFAFPGFVDSHVHLDKACILERCTICEGTLEEAVRETAKAKAGFSQDDVFERASAIVRQAITHGTTRMRTFVEIDPRAGMRSFAAIKRVRERFAFAIDIQICAFAQEGLTQEPETEEMLDEALRTGANLVGGCPYTDPRPEEHIARIFALARRHDVDVDFHLDFSLDPAKTDLPAVIKATHANGYGGRVTIGHLTNLSALDSAERSIIARKIAAAGIAVTVLPATDLFLMGRDRKSNIPRGVTPAHLLLADGVQAAIATNNILNPFTPFGDASLGRMANLYANVMQLSRDEDMDEVFAMVSTRAAAIMRADYGLAVGAPADIVILDAPDQRAAIRSIAPARAGWKAGRKTLVRARPEILEG